MTRLLEHRGACRAQAGLILLSLTLLIVFAAGAGAVHDVGVFQLDGNAQTSVQSTPPADEDWDLICKAHPSTCTFASGVSVPAGSKAATTSNHVDDGPLNGTIFTTGGSKDPNDVSSWRWKDQSGGLPDKDNLLHSFAARYTIPASSDCPAANGATTCELLYFGSDRYDNSGDAQQGFWFFKNEITLNADGTFDGVHAVGDLLIVSDFSNGGDVSTINVYKWTASGLLQINGSTSAQCGTDPTPPDAFCGSVNPTNGTVAPWTFLDKSGNSTYLNGEFYEGGINLSDPTINLAGECFSSFLSETRSSTSTTATLKDFVLGQFAVCRATLTTTPSSASVTPGVAVHDIATVTGNNPSATPSGTVTFFMCSFATGTIDTCDDSDAAHHGTVIGTGALTGSGGVATANSPSVNTLANPLAPGRYCFRAEWPGDENYTTPLAEDGSGECFEVVFIATRISTAQSFFPNDSATVSTADGSNLPNGGSVVFSLYGTLANCQAGGSTGRLYTQTLAVAGGAPSRTVATTNTSVAVPAPTTLFWRVVYSTGSLAYQGRESLCTERATLTITDDPGPGTAP